MEATGLSRSALGRYENDENIDISPFAITTLAEFYGVSTDYLLGLSENKNHPDADIEDLHLSDDAIELLKSGKLNNRLMCELITNPDSPRLLADIEICVDRIADMHIKDMNYMLEQVREEVQGKYSPGENDVSQRTMELAQVDEKIFYRASIRVKNFLSLFMSLSLSVLLNVYMLQKNSSGSTASTAQYTHCCYSSLFC